ncbi:phosphate acyltransferase PlsX [Oenococcus sicerae]|uniref:Phosphate acyltransferase n=1 Tax=Oenococcus sicerae TaxID=2203724 RepID=A0AAJ1R947_9LACO|nr:phosphate acyltransferase PlsX [Oenococcus sicerae]MDN6900348.1 phosphate acyltransferase PlsX [Oenococcus sicerae]QAS69923.1 phosphate acyltransferase PlsX [Oenococcus sicerae]
MDKTYTIAIDAMGGDNAPEEIVKGALLARDNYKSLQLNLYGDKGRILEIIGQSSQERITVINTTETIEMGDEPVRAVRKKKDSSMVVAANAVKDGQADALFSAGNTGALLASGIFIVGRINGIERPGLLTVLPSVDDAKRPWVFMDVGANAEVKPSYLYQFAVIGDFYATHILKRSKPEIRLLNNGAEEDKGDKIHIAAHQLLKKAKQLNFTGNIESRELLNGHADVVVADGFSGNAALKAIEGTALTMFTGLKKVLSTGNWQTKIGALLVKPALKEFAGVLDYNNAGGAVIAGLKAPVVKTHGSAKARAVSNTIGQIQEILISGLVPDITKYVHEHVDQFKVSVEEK